MRSRRFLLTALAVSLLVAGVASFYASSHPDGLSAVAEHAGFADRQHESPTADGPLAGYRTTGIDDDRVSGGLAGILGSVSVLVLAGGLFWALRRRTPTDDESTVAKPDRVDSGA